MRPTVRLLLFFLVGIISPVFFPAPRDYIEKAYRASSVEVFLDEARYTAAPATVAIIRAARGRYLGVRDKASGTTVTVVGTTVVETSGKRSITTPALDDISLNTGCTLSGDEVESVLQHYNSPAAGSGLGTHSVKECERTGIDNGYWLAMFIHESGAGSASQWAGNKGDGVFTANTGNLVCHGTFACYGRFTDYQGDWKLGTTEHFQLLACYRDGGGTGCDGLWNGKTHATITEALNTWAPPSENATDSYAAYVVAQVKEWRTAKVNIAQQRDKPVETVPVPPTVSATNCRAELWPNAADSVDYSYGYHAGAFDWVAPQGTPVYAPACGTLVTVGDYKDKEKYGAYVIMLTDGGLEIYIGHLNLETVNPFNFQPGQHIEAGQRIGDLSKFTYSSPHSHVQLRRDGVLVSSDAWWSEWNSR